jgi:flagellar basal body rod protein FlgC
MTELGLLDAAARAMAAQRSILDVAARNVAAAQAAAPGQSYERLVARFAAPLDDDEEREDDAAPLAFSRERAEGDALTELIAVLDAQRAYEANASIFDAGKRLAERTLDIERT